ncbi:unnamed protein product [Leptidea sinapis]|uniref:Uncharacterized protein n=1 Tax=Leptidea sinapis TaxID=189913 RepID=A0A5E4R5V0_9NEOP|nr:unnamed protein product [Leptidea sinapis]
MWLELSSGRHWFFTWWLYIREANLRGASQMTSTKWLMLAVALVFVSLRSTHCAPAPVPQGQEEYPPMPYEYKYDVEDPEKELYFGANETGDAQGCKGNAIQVKGYT